MPKEATNIRALTPLTHSPDAAAALLSVSLRAIYSMIASKELKSFKLGKRRLIPDEELRRWVASKIV
jgi:excisionase family DNA binding protein